MADRKTSELTELTTPGAEDMVPIVSAGTTKKAAQSNLGVLKNAKKRFGLYGDDSHSDYAGFQDILEEAWSVGSAEYYLPEGTYLIDGALQDTGGANAQLVTPVVGIAQPQVSVKLYGAVRPPVQFIPDSGAVPTGNYSIIKSALTGASGSAAVFGGSSNTSLSFENLIFQMPSNSTLSCLNFSGLQANELRNILIHCGSCNLSNITQPTHSNAYAIRLPPENHSPYIDVHNVTVFGFYNGVQLGELTVAQGLRMWGCYRALEVPFCHHPSLIHDLGVYWCPYGIVGTGDCYLRISLYDLEHANGHGASWQEPVYDVDDASNHIHGDVRWLAVASGSANDHTLYVHGASNFTRTELT